MPITTAYIGLTERKWDEVISSKMTLLEKKLAKQMKAVWLPAPVREFAFHPKRKWRFDFAWPEVFFAVEVDGGQWLFKGGHQSGKGYDSDREKDNVAQMDGWQVFRFTTNMVNSGDAAEFIKTALIKRALAKKVDLV